MKMKDLILKELEEIACGNTGTCQINLQSESARELIANKLEPKLQKYMQEIINKVLIDGERDECCGGGCHEG